MHILFNQCRSYIARKLIPGGTNCVDGIGIGCSQLPTSRLRLKLLIGNWSPTADVGSDLSAQHFHHRANKYEKGRVWHERLSWMRGPNSGILCDYMVLLLVWGERDYQGRGTSGEKVGFPSGFNSTASIYHLCNESGNALQLDSGRFCSGKTAQKSACFQETCC